MNDKPHPKTLSVGQAVNICATGTAIGPARFPMCSDTSSAAIREGDQGPEIVDVKPGAILGYTTAANAVRFHLLGVRPLTFYYPGIAFKKSGDL